MTLKTSKQKFFSFQLYNSYLDNKLAQINLSNNDLFLSNGQEKFYGRINLNGDIITPSIDFLKQIPGSDSQYALNFVCDAFENLTYICSSRENIENSRDFRFIKIKATKGFSNLDNKYNKHVIEIFNLYLNNLKNSKNKNKIIDFDTFIINFIKFIDISANKIPILKSDFIISNKCSILESGLAIELVNIQKNQDDRKVTEFWEAPEFYKFIQNCKRTGFIIDRECPWRIVFNVNLEESKKYMSKYNVDSTNYLNLYTINTEIDEVNNLKKYMIMFYNKILSEEQQIQIPHINQEGKITYNNFIRNNLNIEELEIKYPDSFWFKIYCHLYFVKNNIKLTQSQYNDSLKNLTHLFNHSMPKAIEHLNKILTTTPRSLYKTYEFTI
jgi:hypothetical protein